jgi:hypothetical protein
MSNETVVLNQSNLFITLAGERVTALPDTGTICSIERITATSIMVSGLHNTAVHIINSGKGYRATVNVVPGTKDDELFSNAIKAIEVFSLLPPFAVTYQGIKYVAGSVSIEGEPTRNFNADNVEMMAYPLVGMFQIVKVTRLSNPGVLTIDQINSMA